MASSLKSRLLAYLLTAVAVAGLILWIAARSHHRPRPSFKFINYTNSGGQIEALFRLDHPPQPSSGDGLSELRYHSATGWTRPTAQSISWRFFGWDGTGSIAAVSVETTNVPARVIMCVWARRTGLAGIYDRMMDTWDKWQGNRKRAREVPFYVTNETIITTSVR